MMKMELIESMRVRSISAFVFSCLLGACAVGPDFTVPEAPAVNAYTAAPLPDELATTVADAPQRWATERDIPALWWELFRNQALDELVRRALNESPSLSAAQSVLQQAQENVGVRKGVLSPSVDANVSGTRQRFSPAAIGQPGPSYVFDLYNASVGVTYVFDVAGGWRRELEALGSQVDYQAFQLEAARLALTANVVTTAIKEASLRGQIQATREMVDAQQTQLDLAQQQLKLGGTTRADVLAQRSRLAQTRTALPALEKTLAITRHQLATLVGRFPNDTSLPAFTLDALTLPRELPLTVPSLLVRQRPDIRAAEALWHQACAQVGVATANLYPRIALSGSYGPQANVARDLFAGGATIWSLGASLTQPIFRGGELSARRRVALAAYEQAGAQYRETVLRAFQNVADVLRSLELDAEALDAQTEADTFARETLDLVRQQYRLGATSYLSLLDAQREYQQVHINLIQAQAARYADTAALFQALGGGWWNRAEMQTGATLTDTQKDKP